MLVGFVNNRCPDRAEASPWWQFQTICSGHWCMTRQYANMQSRIKMHLATSEFSWPCCCCSAQKKGANMVASTKCSSRIKVRIARSKTCTTESSRGIVCSIGCRSVGNALTPAQCSSSLLRACKSRSPAKALPGFEVRTSSHTYVVTNRDRTSNSP